MQRPLRHILLVPVIVAGSLGGCTSGARDEAEEAPSDAGWHVHVAEREAGEDHPGSVLLTRLADEVGDGAVRPRLVLGCEEGVTAAYVEWGLDLSRDDVPVTVQVGDGPERSARWRASEDGEAAGLWHDSVSVPFFQSLLGRDRLALQVTPEEGRPLAGTFTLAGLDSLVGQVQGECPWP